MSYDGISCFFADRDTDPVCFSFCTQNVHNKILICGGSSCFIYKLEIFIFFQRLTELHRKYYMTYCFSDKKSEQFPYKKHCLQKRVSLTVRETLFPYQFLAYDQADNTFLPFALLEAKTFLPFAVLILFLKP